MAVKQNALLHANTYPLATSVVPDDFYVDDGITGADSILKVVQLQQQLQELFAEGGFLLRTRKSNEPAALRHFPLDLVEHQPSQELPVVDQFMKVLGLEWNAELDSFRLTASSLPCSQPHTKRSLASDIARVYDILGWF